MNWKPIAFVAAGVAAAVCVAVFVIPSLAKDPADGAAQPAPAAAASPKAATSAPAVAATVGGVEIPSARIEKVIQGVGDRVPPDKLPEVRNRILRNMIITELMHAYCRSHKVAYDEKDLASIHAQLAQAAKQAGMTPQQLMQAADVTEDSLKDQARMMKVAADVTAQPKVDAYIQGHPACFNGTKVQASHILIACEPTGPTKDQQSAAVKLDKIAADIQAGAISFEEAAKTHSACPSGKKAGGDLGEFAFSDMVPPFAEKAFAMKVGDVSGAVRTQYGFHLIKVTKRTEGKDKPGPDAQQMAKNALMAHFQDELLGQAMTSCPIVIFQQ